MLKAIRDTILVALAVTAATLTLRFIQTEYLTARQNQNQVATKQDLEIAAQKSNIELNRGLPTMIDSETMLVRVEASASHDTYFLKMINRHSQTITPDFLIKAQQIVGKRNCTNPDATWAYDQGKFMKYIISGSDNVQAGSFIISKVYCEQIK